MYNRIYALKNNLSQVQEKFVVLYGTITNTTDSKKCK